MLQLPEDGNSELVEVKTTLENVERFNYDNVDHNIVKMKVNSK